MKVDCNEYSRTMELLALRQHLDKGVSDPQEREEIRKRIQALEEELGLS